MVSPHERERVVRMNDKRVRPLRQVLWKTQWVSNHPGNGAGVRHRPDHDHLASREESRYLDII